MNRRFRRTTLLIAFSVAVVLGVASAVANVSFSIIYALLAFYLLVIFLRRRNAIVLLAAVLLGLVVGNWRGASFARLLIPLNQSYNQQVILTATAASDGSYTSKSQLMFDANNLSLNDPVKARVPGKIKIEGFGINSVYRGDQVLVEGKLKDTIGSRQGRISFADIQVVGRSSSFIENTRHNFTAGVQTALPEPQASFGLGLLIGEKSTLPKTASDTLAAVGLTHIIAVSGYNLTIIVAAARRLLAKRSKYQTAIVALLLITGFVLLTGFSASIVRATVVSVLGLTSWYYGRTFRPLLLITFTAAVTAMWNPLYVWNDAGWYLSFLAFYGVLVLAPLIHQRLPGWSRRGVFGMLILESLCAQIMTAPYILFTFKQLSLLALPANLLVVPLVPIAMLLSLIAGLAGMFASVIAGWFAWPARILLTYMLDVAALFARVPHAVLQRTLSVVGLIIVYGAIVLIGATLGHNVARRATITDTNSNNL